MRVTETAVHKINGKPLYNWKRGRRRLEKSKGVETVRQDMRGLLVLALALDRNVTGLGGR